MIVSPCISICKTDPVSGYCYGCARKTEEKIAWKNSETNDERNFKLGSVIKISPELVVKSKISKITT